MTNKKILFVNPLSEFKNPIMPLGLASIAAYLKNKEKDIDIQIIDAWAENLNFENLKIMASRTGADIIGIYMLSPRYDQAKKTIEICRQALPGSLIVAGGPHTSALPVETLQEIPQLDIAVIGEGEITMMELISGLPYSKIDGFAYRENGKLKTTKPRDFIKNLDELPFPNRDLFPLKKYISPPPYGRKNPYFIMITGRGCPFHCAYCCKNVFNDNYRARSPKNVCEEIENLIAKYGAKEIMFTDDDFTLNIKRAEEICDEMMKRCIKIRWSCLTRVDLVTERLLSKMKKAGCWLIAYGLESGNQKILDTVDKGIKISQIISAFEITRKAGIMIYASFVVGLPGETKETINDTFNLVKKVKPNFISGTTLIVYPGSRFAKLIQEGHYKGKTRTLKKNEGMPGFSYKGNYAVFEDNLTYEELREAVKINERNFYFRPQYILQTLNDIRSFSDAIYFFKAGIAVMRSFFK